MTSYNHDEWFAYLETLSEDKRELFTCIFEQLQHCQRDAFSDKETCISRHNFFAIDHESARMIGVTFLSIDIAYFVKDDDSVGMSVNAVHFYTGKDQWLLYKRMNETTSKNHKHTLN